MGNGTRIVEIMKEKPLIDLQGGSHDIPSLSEGSIEFENVSFSYPTKPDVHVLKNISFSIQKNQVKIIMWLYSCLRLLLLQEQVEAASLH